MGLLTMQDEPEACVRLEWLNTSTRAMLAHASGRVRDRGLRWRDVERAFPGIARDSGHAQLEAWTG